MIGQPLVHFFPMAMGEEGGGGGQGGLDLSSSAMGGSPERRNIERSWAAWPPKALMGGRRVQHFLSVQVGWARKANRIKPLCFQGCVTSIKRWVISTQLHEQVRNTHSWSTPHYYRKLNRGGRFGLTDVVLETVSMRRSWFMVA